MHERALIDIPQPPGGLGAAGERLWRELAAVYDIRGNEYLLAELCQQADRAAELRRRMREARDTAELLKLVNAESKVVASAARLWKLLGLHQAELPADLRRGAK